MFGLIAIHKLQRENQEERKNMADNRAKQLSSARLNFQKLVDYPGPDPTSLAEAIALQDQMVTEMDADVVGWKIGCTSEVARQALGAKEPFFGPLLRERFYSSGQDVPTSDQSLRIVETEVAIKLKAPLPPKTEPYSLDEVVSAIGSLCPALEVVNRRAPGSLSDGLFWNVADGGVNDAIVLGHETLETAGFDFAGCKAEAFVNGISKSEGHGSNALGGAHMSLHWLANEFSRLNRTLEKDHIVTTGLVTEIFSVSLGDEVRSEIQGLGVVSASF